METLQPSKPVRAYVPPQRRRQLERQKELQDDVMCCLNLLCIENVEEVVERLACVNLHNAAELEFVVTTIFTKALIEFHNCEAYCDTMYALRSRYPEFPPQVEGEKPITFTRLLLNCLQSTFELLPTRFDIIEDTRVHELPQELVFIEKQKDQMAACMKFIAHLFLRQLIAYKVIVTVLNDLLRVGEGSTPPDEFVLGCACELLETVGRTVDQHPHDRGLMTRLCKRLSDLNSYRAPNGNALFSKGASDAIDDLLNLRSNGWKPLENRSHKVLQCSISFNADISEVRVTCAGLTGEEVCTLECRAEDSVASILRGIAQKVNTPSTRLRVILPDCRCLDNLNSAVSITSFHICNQDPARSTKSVSPPGAYARVDGADNIPPLEPELSKEEEEEEEEEEERLSGRAVPRRRRDH